MSFSEIIAVLLLSIGTFFSVVGIIGMMRLPDVYCRIHASGKVSTLGVISLLAGAVFLMPELILKVVMLAVFLVITAPVASHAIAAAAHRQGVRRVGVVRDDLGAHTGVRSGVE